MDQTILVDSNVYIALLRENRDPAVELTRRFPRLDLVTCGVVRLEVLRGITRPKTKDRLTAFFDVMQNVPTDNRLWNEAAELAWRVDRQGHPVPAADIVIACCARRVGATVLTRDKHFANLPGVIVRGWPD